MLSSVFQESNLSLLTSLLECEQERDRNEQLRRKWLNRPRIIDEDDDDDEENDDSSDERPSKRPRRD